jgi:hypothetical protein
MWRGKTGIEHVVVKVAVMEPVVCKKFRLRATHEAVSHREPGV